MYACTKYKITTIILISTAIFLGGCESCNFNKDKFVTLTNTQTNDVTVQFRSSLSSSAKDGGEYKYFEETVKAGETVEIFVETVEVKANSKVGKIKGTCSVDDEIDKFSAAQFSNNTLSMYTICHQNSGSKGRTIEVIGTDCGFPDATEIVNGY